MKTAEFSRIIYANISAILQSNNTSTKFSSSLIYELCPL